MIIYQIHEYSGEYEDYRDYIVGSYLNKEKAIAKMKELQWNDREKWTQAALCSECPIIDEDEMEDLDTVLKECSKWCGNAKIIKDRFGYDCENYQYYWDEATYDIKEVEVEE